MNEDTVTVAIGGISHPMTPEHFIAWIYKTNHHGGSMELENGGQRKSLLPEQPPQAIFKLYKDKPLAAFCLLQ